MMWRTFRQGLPSTGRYRRYGYLLLPALAAVWLLTFAYLFLLPPSYTSTFSLILPGSGVGSTLNVESIGQAQSTSNSAFASATLSPTETYKQLLSSDTLLRKAAEITRENEGAFPLPSIKLVDQTNLLTITVSGPTPEIAKARAEALRAAFLTQLDELRAGEASQREASDRLHLVDLATKVQVAQRKLIAFQASHGLATMEQFNARIASGDALREKERDLRVTYRQQAGTAGRLGGSLGVGTGDSNKAMRLRGDPLFQQLLQRYADLNAETHQKEGTLGPNHASLAQTVSERDETRKAMVRRGRELTGLPEGALMQSIDLQVADGRSNLMQALVVGDAQAAGSSAALSEVRSDMARVRAESPRLIEEASQLAELQRDYRVADAVFSSALARIDTNKQDPYASYPLVQTLAAPSLPRSPSSPSLVIALAGALLTSILILMAFLLLWLRQPILDRILRNA